MSAFAAAGRALAAARTLTSSGNQGGGGGSWWLLLLAVPLALLIALVLGIMLLLAGAVQQCEPGADTQTAAEFSGPGSLGGVAGTGLTRAQIDGVRTGSPYAGTTVTSGEYLATSYGPPWGGIQGQGIATSGGLRIGAASPRWYMIAVDPRLIGHGTLVYLWPNPFGWHGPFLAADTGGAIQGQRIDFYDWRGRLAQYRWGHRHTTASPTPQHDDAPQVLDIAPVSATACAATEPDHAGEPDALALPGVQGRVTIAPLANATGRAVRPELIQFLERVAGIAGRELVLTTGTNHSKHSSSGRISDHWVGLGADFGSVANRFPLGGGFGTRLAAAGLRAAGVPETEAWRLAQAGGGHDVCHHNWRIQVIWRTGDHHDHVHIGLRPGCAFTGVQTFQI
ncbi:3D domain-containing protein [Solirubrobacter sp. CPCC 204708]|uniref:3D domain-containing protein n=1 Tax=Solirubrobacter deserti TaxID=2282478 RepID=A0ABT4RLI6_9ACTN|nr:3D domain-containing protein [Solirubrobacter deserti]MBE2320380.1 3D domain-containing protein [Solirubrobacter deserti]MDA0139425.1 3D domain-containing protein [Solirubrobacter deserti]